MTPAPSRLVRFLHLFALSGFAIAQPLLEQISRRTMYFTDQNLPPAGLLLIVAALLFAAPLLLFAIEELIERIAARGAWRAHLVFVFLLAWLAFCGAVRSIVDSTLRDAGVPWFVSLFLATAGAAVVWRLYRRSRKLHLFLTIAAVGVLAFPAKCLFASPAYRILVPEPEVPPATMHAANPVPIVMVVFDEFSGLAILDVEGRIDAATFPNFARLEQQANWFPAATTVHHRTERALPAMMTGMINEKTSPSTEAYFPDNLFALLRRTSAYDRKVFEPFTRLCTPKQPGPDDLQRAARPRPAEIAWTLAAVYRHITLPIDTPLPETPVPRAFFNMGEMPSLDGGVDPDVVRFPWDGQHERQFRDFLEGLQPADRPRIDFLHVAVPHYPWANLPSGRTYAPELRFGEFAAAMWRQEEWIDDKLGVRNCRERYQLQVGYADHFIGRLIDTLQERGLWDDCLLIVTADHGAAFAPGLNRREPMRDNVPEIAGVPLFIKLPGNERLPDALRNRNVEIIDILPTIAEVIDMPLSGPVDGQSILDAARSDRPRKTLEVDNHAVLLRPDFAERFDTLKRLHADFQTPIPEEYGLGGMPDWVGADLEDFRVEGVPQHSLALALGGSLATETVVPCVFEGCNVAWDLSWPPQSIVIAVNGGIGAVTRTYDDERAAGWFSAIVSEDLFHEGENEIAIYEVLSVEQRILRPCRLTPMDAKIRRY
ncbi:MAG: sulfatase-like hydrolase/transferase [Planctomyces sp.]|nr:sulfatase-like hydrolase/transferase [Planctomyces sp.]